MRKSDGSLFITSVYAANYKTTGHFGDAASSDTIGTGQQPEVYFTRTIHKIVSAWGADTLGLGGWMLSPMHVYDPTSGVLYQGDGHQRQLKDGSSIRLVAGNGTTTSGPKSSATCVTVRWPRFRIIRTASRLNSSVCFFRSFAMFRTTALTGSIWGPGNRISSSSPIGGHVKDVGACDARSMQATTATVDCTDGTYMYAVREQVAQGYLVAWGDEWITYSAEWTGTSECLGDGAFGNRHGQVALEARGSPDDS